MPMPGTGVPGTAPAACTLQPAPAYLRRLSNVEYARTVRDLLGLDVAFPSNTPPDTPLHGFDNNRATLAISASHLANYGVMADVQVVPN